ncbi:hypothetical protein GE061_016500 [Apolygus lucorum]|uniref:glutathione transferase n=1 Tax=Apolygus lucorum TaxID=248454 RepID=A0A8S9XG78_APOLU|nr:hypothetical protein GE061_016500 [Apolygus lucorum]
MKRRTSNIVSNIIIPISVLKTHINLKWWNIPYTHPKYAVLHVPFHHNRKMPVYKVTYFDARARGEPIRWLLSYLGEDFVDNRIKLENWPAMKKDVVFGKLPILDVDDKRIYQTAAICRFLGQKAKLAGDNDWEGIQIDSIHGTIEDFMNVMAPIRRAEGMDRKEALNAIQTKRVVRYATAIPGRHHLKMSN